MRVVIAIRSETPVNQDERDKRRRSTHSWIEAPVVLHGFTCSSRENCDHFELPDSGKPRPVTRNFTQGQMTAC